VQIQAGAGCQQTADGQTEAAAGQESKENGNQLGAVRATRT
jgi:hypothetical protein